MKRPFQNGGKLTACYESTILLSFLNRCRYTLLRDDFNRGRAGRYAEAEPLYQQVLTILEQIPQTIDPVVGQLRGNFAKLYHDQGRYAEAEPLYVSALAMWKQHQPKNRKWVTFMKNIAAFYFEQGRYAEAEPLCQQALTICEQVLGPEDPDVANILESYASLLRNTKREAKAAEYEVRVKTIRAKVQG